LTAPSLPQLLSNQLEVIVLPGRLHQDGQSDLTALLKDLGSNSSPRKLGYSPLAETGKNGYLKPGSPEKIILPSRHHPSPENGTLVVI
jgi:hypothetical protein